MRPNRIETELNPGHIATHLGGQLEPHLETVYQDSDTKKIHGVEQTWLITLREAPGIRLYVDPVHKLVQIEHQEQGEFPDKISWRDDYMISGIDEVRYADQHPEIYPANQVEFVCRGESMFSMMSINAKGRARFSTAKDIENPKYPYGLMTSTGRSTLI